LFMAFAMARAWPEMLRGAKRIRMILAFSAAGVGRSGVSIGVRAWKDESRSNQLLWWGLATLPSRDEGPDVGEV